MPTFVQQNSPAFPPDTPNGLRGSRKLTAYGLFSHTFKFHQNVLIDVNYIFLIALLQTQNTIDVSRFFFIIIKPLEAFNWIIHIFPPLKIGAGSGLHSFHHFSSNHNVDAERIISAFRRKRSFGRIEDKRGLKKKRKGGHD